MPNDQLPAFPVPEGLSVTHSTDAGRYGGTPADAVVRQFRDLASEGHPVETARTDGNNALVILTYTPGNMPLEERFKLLDTLRDFAVDQQSWHGDWFLWNVVTVTDQQDRANSTVRLTIA